MSSLHSCYICNGPGCRANRLVVCAGPTLVAAIHAGVVSEVNDKGETISKLAPIMTDEGKATRDAMRKCETVPLEGRAFHPACEGRDPARANAKTLYSTGKKKTQFFHRDQTHRLCGACLTKWQEDGGQVGALAKKRQHQSITLDLPYMRVPPLLACAIRCPSRYEV